MLNNANYFRSTTGRDNLHARSCLTIRTRFSTLLIA